METKVVIASVKFSAAKPQKVAGLQCSMKIPHFVKKLLFIEIAIIRLNIGLPCAMSRLVG